MRIGGKKKEKTIILFWVGSKDWAILLLALS